MMQRTKNSIEKVAEQYYDLKQSNKLNSTIINKQREQIGKIFMFRNLRVLQPIKIGLFVTDRRCWRHRRRRQRWHKIQ